MRIDDLVITLSYFSIPIQIVVCLCYYPRLASIPGHVLVLLIFFALFIFLCGAGHLLRCMGWTESDSYRVINVLTAIISSTTAVYLLPLVPNIMSSLDQGLQDLVKLNEETAESKRKLVTFMAFLCHEIRNPLFAITSSISFLEDESMTESQQKGLDMINQSASLMLRLVNDVLDISKIESGKLELEHHPFDLPVVLDGVTATSRVHMDQKHQGAVDLVTTISPQLPRYVCGDSARIMQIANNLLSNAIKFTEKGVVHFSAEALDMSTALRDGLVSDPLHKGEIVLATCDEDHRKSPLLNKFYTSCGCSMDVALKLTVTDTGPGIAPDRIDQLFQPYCQAKLSDYRKHGGTGLGLAILARLTKIMGGTIHLRSEEGKGSTFTVYLPLHVLSDDGSKELNDNHIASALVMPDEADSCDSMPDEVFSDFSNESCSPASFACGDVKEGLAVVASRDVETGLFAPGAIPFLPLSSAINTPPRTLMNSPAKIMPEGSSITPRAALGRNKQRLLPFNFLPMEAVVLVVDDNMLNRKILGKMLSQFNVEYLQACNGLEGVNYMKTSRNFTGNPQDPYIAFIITDLSMPVMDGCEEIRIIRQKLNLNVPIVALTANALEEGRDKVLEAGATEFATKPIIRDELYAKCKKYLAGPSDFV